MILVVYILFCSLLLNLVRSLPTSDSLFNGSGIFNPSARSGLQTSPKSFSTTTAMMTMFTTTTVFLTQTVTSSTASSTLDLPTTAEESGSPISTGSVLSPASSASYTSSSTTVASTWIMPAQITNIAQAFNITKFGDNQSNSKIVNQIPANASASESSSPNVLSSTDVLYVPIASPSALGLRFPSPGLIQIPFENHSDSGTSSSSPDDHQSSSQSVLQIFYPQGSINPANAPRGGSQFYASPIDISSARNVTFSYGVFFPVNFDFVKGGKLPGLYGGHSGCSGGDTATTCFSTRLMWRDEGRGELYLYAPKDKQSPDLCSENHTVCESTYGISIGRGTFLFQRGKWTYVSQTATLNTPGQQDGCFTLDVNGERVIDRKDIFYRDITYWSESSSGRTTGNPSKQPSRSPKKNIQHIPSHLKSPLAIPLPLDSLDPPPNPKIGGGLLGILSRNDSRNVELAPDELSIQEPDDTQTHAAGVQELDDTEAEIRKVTSASSQLSQSQSFEALSASGREDSAVYGLDLVPIASSPTHPVGFVGIFFSTFFGGHRPDWASPRDQHVWFKDFSLVNNG
ncbi:hypothetical protein E1B28_002358 [Marasmius oreades]|uniref:Polysaccharide lyase 14 domain-containing protein n=1 Tax=Marasmius oreades TaxID=181124 RepID=A0A9P7ULA1_9AGAR|nr:uncharacterized protein E1B28_002358 [Marasmius oreades]KAG7086403.1 hypothetical protein E1B28_002358 [Marasmius oreades]